MCSHCYALTWNQAIYSIVRYLQMYIAERPPSPTHARPLFTLARRFPTSTIGVGGVPHNPPPCSCSLLLLTIPDGIRFATEVATGMLGVMHCR
jgi:hypothetical protein